MAQRGSGYERQPDELYETPRWVAAVIGQWLREAGVRSVWEPAPGSGRFAGYLRDEGCEVTTTAGDFFFIEKFPKVEAIVTNPPYGEARNGSQAASFVRTALATGIPIVAMLMPVDFDSGKTRRDIFADCARFAGKIVLLDRIVFFERKGAAPSSNHCWMIWDKEHNGRPWIAYGLNEGGWSASRRRIKPRDDLPQHLGDGAGGSSPPPGGGGGATQRSRV